MNTMMVKAYTGAVTNTVVDVETGTTQCRFAMFDIGNNNAAVSYVQVFNRAAANVTLGTTTPLLSFEVPANSGRVVAPGFILNFGGDGFSIAATTTRAGSTAPGAAVDVNIAR